MKKIFTSAIALLVLTFASVAQSDNGSRAQQQERKNNRINPRALEQLNLTEAQNTKLKDINDDYRNKMREVIKSDMTADQRKTRRYALETEKKDRILAMLTSEQRAKLQTIQNAFTDDTEYKEKYKTDDEKVKIKVKKDD